MACILLGSSAVRVHDSQAYRKMDVTRELISRILELREMLLSFQTGFNLVNAAVVCAILESISDLEPSAFSTVSVFGSRWCPMDAAIKLPSKRDTLLWTRMYFQEAKSYFTRGGTNRGILVTTRNTLGWGKNVLTKFTISEVVLTWVYRGVWGVSKQSSWMCCRNIVVP